MEEVNGDQSRDWSSFFVTITLLAFVLDEKTTSNLKLIAHYACLVTNDAFIKKISTHTFFFNNL